jgi:hypothetical protein
MEMKRNQYIKIDNTIEEIAKTKIKFDGRYDDREGIEELGIEEGVNVLIYKNERGDGEEFINIYSGIRVLITTKKTIDTDRYKKLPENIEYVIIDRMIYSKREEIEMMEFKSRGSLEEYAGELVRSGRYEERNKRGESILYWLVYSGLMGVISRYVELKEMIEKK